MIEWIKTVLLFDTYCFILLFIPAFIIFKISKKIKFQIENKKNIKLFQQIDFPKWNYQFDDNGYRQYKFQGFTNYDTKSKVLGIDTKPLLSNNQKVCWNLINEYFVINKHIKIYPQIPIRQIINITDKNILLKDWETKFSSLCINYIICDFFFNPIAAINFKSDTTTDNIIDDIFYDIRIPIFWIDNDIEIFKHQIKYITNEINNYFKKSDLTNNNRRFSKIYQDSE